MYPFQFDRDDESFDHSGRHHQNYFDPPPFGPPPMGQPPFGPQPMGPPPNFSPPMPAWQVGHSGIRSCLFRNTYIWLNSGRSFWFYPVHVGRESITGFRWSRRNGWRPRTINRNNIRSFQCFRY